MNSPSRQPNSAGRPLVDEIDRASPFAAARPDLNIGLLLWPEFPILSLAGLADALRHAADLGDNSQKLRCLDNHGE